MATVQSSESKAGRWSKDLEQEIEAIEVMELLRASTPPPRPDACAADDDDQEETVISRELLSEMGRRLAPVSVAPPPAPRRCLPAGWIALVAAVAVLSFVCARAFATLDASGAAPIAPASTAAALAPAAPIATSEAALPTSPRETAAARAAVVVTAQDEDARAEHGVPAIDRGMRAAERDSVQEPAAIESPIPDNPYESDVATAPAPAAAPAARADKPANAVEQLITSALARPDRSRSAASAPATNDLPDADARALPELPSRGEVSRAMDSVAVQVRKCGSEAGGRLVVELRIAGATGRVRDARTVDERWSGTSTGACAARAVRVAKLPRFAASDLVVRYPFDI